ncbi:unnamed protein product [Cercospora beticola]|nr:unnamed protein product [Cercospora beticola]
MPRQDADFSDQSRHLLGKDFQCKQRDRRPEVLLDSKILTSILFATCLLSLTYYAGYRHGKQTAFPTMSTHYITADSTRYVIKTLDDNFEVRQKENALFKGPPRPEHEAAWRALIRGMNIRVPSSAAAASNFSSFELLDGTGDVWATPFLFHQLHCLKTIREAQYPERYPQSWEVMKPQETGEMSRHFDHCLENLRQSVLCQGDMSLSGYEWDDNGPRSLMGGQHVCVDWERMYKWVMERSFDIWDTRLTGKWAQSLRHPEEFYNASEVHW